MQRTVLSDETWAALDPRSGSLTRTEVRRLRLGLLTMVALLAAALLLWWSGVVAPHLAEGSERGFSADMAEHHFSLQQTLTNRGWHTEQVIGVGRSGPGLELVRVSGLPLRLAPGDSATVDLFYRVTDCAAVPTGDWPIPVRVHRVWGSMTADLQPQDMSRIDTQPDTMLPWQLALARTACASGTMAP